MFFRHGYDKLIYPIIALVFLTFISYRAGYRLRPDMPREFFAADAPCGPKRPLEQRIACAYWDSAQMNIQWKYPHGHPLPVNAPPEFGIDALALGPTASSPATRDFYWHRLRQIWFSPETWKQIYEWNLSWVSDPLSRGGQWLGDATNRVFTIH